MTEPSPAVAAVQRRTVRVLAGTQVLGGVGVGSGIAVAGLLAEDVSGSTTLSGLASTTIVLGTALAALPLARLSGRRGRRPGLATGWAVGAVGGLLVVAGAEWDSFALLLLGALLFGAATAANLQSRYAATDLADPAHRGRALSVVVWATTIGAVLGPNLTGPGAATARALQLPELAGPLVFSVAAFGVGSFAVAALLRPDPLLVARAGGEAADRTPHHHGVRSALGIVRSSPGAVLGITTVALGHTFMVAVMTMTPVHMRHGGAELEVVGLVISVHIAGMYALSPLVGWLVDRAGRVPVIVLAQVLLLGSVVVSGGLAHSSAALGVGLFVLGVGWSCAVVAGSTLLSESVPAATRPGVQGAADFAMNVAGALGGAGSGVVLAGLGYGGLNAVAAVLAVPVLLLVFGRPRRPTPALAS